MPFRIPFPHSLLVPPFLRFSVLFLATFTLGFLAGNLFPKKLSTPPLTVTRILDGDTVELSDGRHLRLRGINAPELNKYECLAVAAKDRLSQLLLTKAITLDPSTAVVDNFGRTVAVIIKTADRKDPGKKDFPSPEPASPSAEQGGGESFFSDGKIKNTASSLDAFGADPAQILVAEGLARAAAPYPSETYKEKLFTLEEAAKDNQLGLWQTSSCPQPTPVPAGCNIKGNVHWKKRQKLYFPPDCSGYSRVTVEPKNGDRWFCSVDAAETAGFNLASTCSPPNQTNNNQEDQ